MSRYKRPTVRYTLDAGSHVDAWHRFSNSTQDDASALSAIERYCVDHGLVLDRMWGKPATSGSVITSTREFGDFVAAMEERPEAERRQRGIVVWKLNRLGRDQVESDYYTAHLRRLGYAVISVADPATQSDIQPVLEAFIRWKDQKLLEDISADVKRTMAWLRQDGYSTGGRPPKGFIAVHEENRSKPRKYDGSKRVNARWVRGGPDENATMVAWQMKVAGASDREIHAATHLLKDTHCYHDMWRRPCYAAAGYVEQADWQQVQQEMDERSYAKQHPRRLGSAYLLSGLLFCTCGRAMTGWSEPRGHGEKRTDTYHPSADAFSYYRCMTAKRGEGCAMTARVRAEVIDRAVLQAVTDELLTDGHLAGLRERLEGELGTASQNAHHELAMLRDRLAKVRKSIANLTSAIEDGADAKPLIASLRERSHEETVLRDQIADAETREREYDPTIIDDKSWQELVDWARTGLASGDTRQRRRIIESIVRRIDLWPERSGFTLHYSISPNGSGLWLVSPQGIEP